MSEIDNLIKAAVKERDEFQEKYQLLCTTLPQINSGFDNIIEKLVLFGRIWAAVSPFSQRANEYR